MKTIVNPKGQAETSNEGKLEMKHKFNSSITLLCLSIASHDE